MKKNLKNKILVLSSIALFIISPVATWILTAPLARYFCTPQILIGTEVCNPNVILFGFITFAVPFITGLILLLIALIGMFQLNNEK